MEVNNIKKGIAEQATILGFSQDAIDTMLLSPYEEVKYVKIISNTNQDIDANILEQQNILTVKIENLNKQQTALRKQQNEIDIQTKELASILDIAKNLLTHNEVKLDDNLSTIKKYEKKQEVEIMSSTRIQLEQSKPEINESTVSFPDERVKSEESVDPSFEKKPKEVQEWKEVPSKHKNIKKNNLKLSNKILLDRRNNTYSVKESLFASNNNLKLLKLLGTKAVIESSITTKYVDTLPDISRKDKCTVKFISEDNHSTQHGDNTRAIIKQINSGEVNSKTVIALELKQYGKNLGMRDVIMLANIISHNEKYQGNPDKHINIPPEINREALIYQDAILYKVAKESGVKIIGLEGNNLGATKKDAGYILSLE